MKRFKNKIKCGSESGTKREGLQNEKAKEKERESHTSALVTHLFCVCVCACVGLLVAMSAKLLNFCLCPPTAQVPVITLLKKILLR